MITKAIDIMARQFGLRARPGNGTSYMGRNAGLTKTRVSVLLGGENPVQFFELLRPYTGNKLQLAVGGVPVQFYEVVCEIIKFYDKHKWRVIGMNETFRTLAELVDYVLDRETLSTDECLSILEMGVQG